MIEQNKFYKLVDGKMKKGLSESKANTEFTFKTVIFV